MPGKAVVPARPRGLMLGRQSGGMRRVEVIEMRPQVIDRAQEQNVSVHVHNTRDGRVDNVLRQNSETYVDQVTSTDYAHKSTTY